MSPIDVCRCYGLFRLSFLDYRGKDGCSCAVREPTVKNKGRLKIPKSCGDYVMVKAQTTYTGQIHGKRGIPHKTLHLLRIVSVCLLSSFLLFLTACSNIFAAPAQSGASTVTAQVTPTRAVSPTPTSPTPTSPEPTFAAAP